MTQLVFLILLGAIFFGLYPFKNKRDFSGQKDLLPFGKQDTKQSGGSIQTLTPPKESSLIPQKENQGKPNLRVLKSMSDLLQKLLNDLEELSLDYIDVFDSLVREKMREVIMKEFVLQNGQGPEDFDMMNDESNVMLRNILTEFVSEAKELAREQKLKNPKLRLNAFQNETLKSPKREYTLYNFFRTLEL